MAKKNKKNDKELVDTPISFFLLFLPAYYYHHFFSSFTSIIHTIQV